jgi:GntR family transcriptional regulator
MRAIGIEVSEVTEEVSVRPAARVESSALAIAVGAVVVVVDRVHHAVGLAAVECTEIVVPADRYRLRYRFEASQATGNGVVITTAAGQ